MLSFPGNLLQFAIQTVAPATQTDHHIVIPASATLGFPTTETRRFVLVSEGKVGTI